MTVSIKNLTKVYGEQKAVNNISFDVQKGEIVGFLGPNGAGKSTTMKMITCYTLPTSGEAVVCGYDVYENSLEVRKKIGYLPENNPLYLEMYVREYLSFMAMMHGIQNRKQRINEMIEKTGLELEVNKKLAMLSKGYRQRVGLAQALLHDPEVLILDEPTSGLDPNQIVDIRNLIKEIGKEKTVILSTHIMQEVQAMCSRIIIINKGKIVADDQTEKLMENFAQGITIKVQFKNEMKAELLREIPGVRDVLYKDGYWVLNSQKEQDIRESVMKFAAAHDNLVLELSSEKQDLENIFRQLTQTGKGDDTNREKQKSVSK